MDSSKCEICGAFSCQGCEEEILHCDNCEYAQEDFCDCKGQYFDELDANKCEHYTETENVHTLLCRAYWIQRFEEGFDPEREEVI